MKIANETIEQKKDDFMNKPKFNIFASLDKYR